MGLPAGAGGERGAHSAGLPLGCCRCVCICVVVYVVNVEVVLLVLPWAVVGVCLYV